MSKAMRLLYTIGYSYLSEMGPCKQISLPKNVKNPDKVYFNYLLLLSLLKNCNTLNGVYMGDIKICGKKQISAVSITQNKPYISIA
jgi:hypothetical protein